MIADRRRVAAGGRPTSRRAAGFTIVELITTIFILSILAVILVPRMEALRGWDEIGYRDRLRGTLEYARKTAVAQRRYVCVTRDGNDLVLTRNLLNPEAAGSASCGADPVELFARDNRYCGNNPPPNRICAPAGVTLGGTDTTYIFSPLGTRQGSSANASYTITGDSTQTVTVEAETGYVH